MTMRPDAAHLRRAVVVSPDGVTQFHMHTRAPARPHVTPLAFVLPQVFVPHVATPVPSLP